MTARTKSTLIVLATLLVGIALGALGTVALSRARHHHGSERTAGGEREGGKGSRRGGGIGRTVERVVQPTDEAQRTAIRQITQPTGRRIGQINRNARQQIEAELDSMTVRLNPLLTPDQQTRWRDARAQARVRLQRRFDSRRPPDSTEARP